MVGSGGIKPKLVHGKRIGSLESICAGLSGFI